jgi:hypothetical protein
MSRVIGKYRKITSWMPTLLNRPKGRSKERWWDTVCAEI